MRSSGPNRSLLERRFVLAPNAFGGQELGDDDVRAELPAEPTERRLRHSRHRREDTAGISWSTGYGKRIIRKLTGLWKSCNVKDLTRLAEPDNFGRLWGAGCRCPSCYETKGTRWNCASSSLKTR